MELADDLGLRDVRDAEAMPGSGDSHIDEVSHLPLRPAVRLELVETDVDLTSVNWTQVHLDNRLILVIYALSYGLYEINVPLYSTARYLGYMEYTMP